MPTLLSKKKTNPLAILILSSIIYHLLCTFIFIFFQYIFLFWLPHFFLLSFSTSLSRLGFQYGLVFFSFFLFTYYFDAKFLMQIFQAFKKQTHLVFLSTPKSSFFLIAFLIFFSFQNLYIPHTRKKYKKAKSRVGYLR